MDTKFPIRHHPFSDCRNLLGSCWFVIHLHHFRTSDSYFPGLGAGGGSPSAAHYNVITYTTLYAVFTMSGFFGGSIMNTIGPKWTMTVLLTFGMIDLC